MYRIEVRKKAIISARETFMWYEEHSEGLGNKFLSGLEDCYKRIQANPFNYSVLEHNIRKIRVEHFPYLLLFEIKGSRIVVYAIFHTSRRPLN